MEIRDVIHGAIPVENHELAIVDSEYFQRLRHIKQLGFSEYSFPSASHNRYVHSLGAMHTASQAIHQILNSRPELEQIRQPERFSQVVRLAALLHDVGHGPLSHTSEMVMGPVGELGFTGNRQATHEDYTLKIILDSKISPVIDQIGEPLGFNCRHVAGLVDPNLNIEDDFFVEKIEGESIDFRTLLQQVISSEIDADRMDYLLRDSLHAGVSYGHFDFNWLLSNLTAHFHLGNAHLCLKHRALYSFEDFLLSRYHMFLMVYFHYKGVVFDEMLRQYFLSSDCGYQLPTNIEEYVRYHDSHLYAHLAQSQNIWARRIWEKKPYRLLLEVHSGIPASGQLHEEQKKRFEEIEARLKEMDIEALRVQSTSVLSKYFESSSQPIFVEYHDHLNREKYLSLQECTDLFTRYNEKRSIRRLYVSPEDYPNCLELSDRHQR